MILDFPSTADIVGNSLIFYDSSYALAQCELHPDQDYHSNVPDAVEVWPDDSEDDAGEFFRLRPETLRILDTDAFPERGTKQIFFDSNANQRFILDDFPALKTEIERRAYLAAVERWERHPAQLNDDPLPDYPVFEPARALYEVWQAVLAEDRAAGFRNIAKVEAAYAAYKNECPKTKVEIELANVLKFPKQPEQPKPRYLFETVAELRNLPQAKWLVEGWIPESGVGLFYGEYAAGKSFIGFDLLLHVVYGLPDWHGVKLPGVPCDALLIAREGAKGFVGRIDAFKKHHGITDDTDRLAFMRSPVNFGDPPQFEELRVAIKATGRQFRMVLVDTVGRALPGEDLYDPKSITRFMEHLQQVGEITGGVAIGVHHENKSGGLFGSVYFGASSDFMFRVEREGSAEKGDPLRRGNITCTKMKDGADGWSKSVTYQTVADSLVVESLGDATKKAAGTKLTTSEELAMRALDAVRGTSHRAKVDDWRDQLKRDGTLKSDDTNQRATYKRIRDGLVRKHVIEERDGWISVRPRAALTPLIAVLPPPPSNSGN